MSPEVTAAIIAASVSFLTLIGTLAAQLLGRRATKQDTKEAFKEQREQLGKTLAEQSKPVIAPQGYQADPCLLAGDRQPLGRPAATP